MDNAICMVIGWPETWSKGAEKFFGWCHEVGIIKDRYFKVGHAALCLIHKDTGEIQYFDFGRYTCDHGMGRVRGSNTDPHLNIPLQAEFDPSGQIANLKEITRFLFSITRYTHGDGMIYFSLYHKMDWAKSLAFVDDLQQQGSVRYTTFAPNSTNCSRFVLGTLLAGSSSAKDKAKFVLTPTLRASPVGTVVDAGYESGVYRQQSAQEALEHFQMGRMGNIKLIFNNIKGNFSGEKVVRPDLIDKGEQPENVPQAAKWLGGLGEGNWIHLRAEEAVIRATAYYHDGSLNYDTVVADSESRFNPQSPHEITYDCNRLFVTVLQAGQRIRLRLVEDYPQYAKRMGLAYKMTTS